MSSRVPKQNQAGEKSDFDRGKSVAELRENNFGLALSRAVGNQGLKRLLRTNLRRLEPLSSATVMRRGAPVSPHVSNAPLTIQTKLAINAPGDSFEQEADHVAERVIPTSDSEVQRERGREGPGSSTRKPGNVGQPIQAKRTEGSASVGIAAPPSWPKY